MRALSILQTISILWTRLEVAITRSVVGGSVSYSRPERHKRDAFAGLLGSVVAVPGVTGFDASVQVGGED